MRRIWYLVMVLFLCKAVYAFNYSSYVKTDIEEYSSAKVKKVKKIRKEVGTFEKFGISFNTLPGQKIQVKAEFITCSSLSHRSSNFLKVGMDMNVLNPSIYKIAEKECRLSINGKPYTFFAQTAVANFMESESKNMKSLSGTAYLVYLGVSNEDAKYLLNRFNLWD